MLSGFFSDVVCLFHIGWEYLTIHVEPIENSLCFVDQGHGVRNIHELSKVSLTKFMDKVELAVGEQSGTADTAQDVAWFAFNAPPVFYRTFSF